MRLTAAIPKPPALIAATFLTAAFLTAVAAAAQTGPNRATSPAPVFHLDASWPKLLPNKWIVGQASGTAVGSRDQGLDTPPSVDLGRRCEERRRPSSGAERRNENGR